MKLRNFSSVFLPVFILTCKFPFTCTMKGQSQEKSTDSPGTVKMVATASFGSSSSNTPRGESLRATSSAATSFRSVTSMGSSSFGSTVSDPGSPSTRRDSKSKRIHYVDVKEADKSTFLTEVKSLPVLTTMEGLIRLEIEELPYCDFCNEVAKKTRQEMGEPEVIQSAKERLVDRLKNSDLNVPWKNDAWLVRFLRLRSYDVSATFELISKYYELKRKHKKLFNKIDVKALRKIFERDIFVVMPNRDQAGRRIIIFRAKNWNLSKTHTTDVLRLAVLYAEASSYEPITQIVGVVIIIDMDGFSFRHGLQFLKRQNAKMIMDFIQESAPFKVERFHILNQSSVVNKLITFFSYFVTDVVHGKAIFHGEDREKLHKYVHREYLPRIYGGTLPIPHIEGTEWDEILELASLEYEKIRSYGLKGEGTDDEEHTTTSDDEDTP